MSEENPRTILLAKRYPILKDIKAEKRRELVKKAVMHPIVLIFAFVTAGFILPKFLGFLSNYLNIHSQSTDLISILKLVALVALPFAVIFTIFNKILIPLSLKRVLKKEGYIPKE